MTRLGYDLSIRRHPYAGTARYADELLRALRETASARDVVVATLGFPRGPRGTRLRRYVHLLEDLAWWSAGIPAVAARERIDAWLGPANTLPLVLPRPCVVTIHDANFLVRPDDYDRGYRIYAERMFRHAAQRADLILADSLYAANELVDRLGAPRVRIRVAYPGLDHALRIGPDPADPGLPARYALFVGQTEPHKNVGLLIEAWQAGVPNDLHLVIAGPPGRDDDRLRSLAAASPHRHAIHLVGRVPDRALAGLYANATCFVMPSRTEGFGFPPLEAMARGIPTAVARAGSLPEITDGGAALFDPDDVAGLAAVIRQLADDPEERARLAGGGRQAAAKYRWHATATVAWQAVWEAVQRS